ncbi:MAG: ribose-phosphate pyrophosphokinae, partial [Labilithrix sp.]|nr:ribose-phosphate pyrophosphokinae [Labilithrix sp.]
MSGVRRIEDGVALITGSSHPRLAEAVAAALERPLDGCAVAPFPDGEMEVTVAPELRGRDVYVVQSTAPPVGENVLELGLIADALHRAGAARVTAVVPYLGYARQERRTRAGEPLGAKVVADLVACGGLARLVAIDLHAPSVEGFFPMPIEHVTAVPILAEAARRHVRADTVVVSPDLGGAKLAREYGRRLACPV